MKDDSVDFRCVTHDTVVEDPWMDVDVDMSRKTICN